MHRTNKLPAFPGVATAFKTLFPVTVCAAATVGIGTIAVCAAANGEKHGNSAQRIYAIFAKFKENMYVARCLASLRGLLFRSERSISCGLQFSTRCENGSDKTAQSSLALHKHIADYKEQDHDTVLTQLLDQYLQARTALTQRLHQHFQHRTPRSHLLLLRWYTGVALLRKAGFAIHTPGLALPWYGMGITDVACDMTVPAPMGLPALEFEELNIVVEPRFTKDTLAAAQAFAYDLDPAQKVTIIQETAPVQKVGPGRQNSAVQKLAPAQEKAPVQTIAPAHKYRKPRPTKITMPPKEVQRTGLEGKLIPTTIPLKPLSGNGPIPKFSPTTDATLYHQATYSSINQQRQISTAHSSSWESTGFPEAPDYISYWIHGMAVHSVCSFDAYCALRQCTAPEQRKNLHERKFGPLQPGKTEIEAFADVAMANEASRAYTHGSLSHWSMTLTEWYLYSALASVVTYKAQSQKAVDAYGCGPSTPPGFASSARGMFAYDGSKEKKQEQEQQKQQQQQRQQQRQQQAHSKLSVAPAQPPFGPLGYPNRPSQQHAAARLHRHKHNQPKPTRHFPNHEPTNGSPVSRNYHPVTMPGSHGAHPNAATARFGRNRYQPQPQPTTHHTAGPLDHMLSEANRQLGRGAGPCLPARFVNQQAAIGTGRPGGRGVAA